VYQFFFLGGEKWTNGDTRPPISGESFPFSQKEFAKLPPILGSVLPPVYLPGNKFNDPVPKYSQ
jgi:hypothetical protein